MTVFLWILVGYVISIFINRLINRIVIYLDNNESPIVGLWFVPVAGTLFMILILIWVLFDRYESSGIFSWFRGNGWKE